MNRREALAATVAGGLVLTGVAGEPARPTDAEQETLREGGPVVTKTFLVSLRERLTDKEAAKLREFIDPRYLKEHGLQDGDFPIQRVMIGSIHSNHLAADPATALTVAGTEGGAKECFLFRLAVHEGKVYIAPLKAPEAKSKSFSPWILRVKV